jgi:hypothetical protein
MLPSTFSTFAFRFRDLSGNVVPIAYVDAVDVLRPDGSSFNHWAERFAIDTDGAIRPTTVQAWRDALSARQGKIELSVMAVDARGRHHFGRFSLFITKFIVQPRLAAPPSNPGLAVGGVYVIASILNTDLVFRAVTAADGSFSLPPLPRGNLEISAETEAGGRKYYGLAVLPVNDHIRLTVTMLDTSDTMNGVPFYSIETLPMFARVPNETLNTSERERTAGRGALPFQSSITASTAAAVEEENGVMVTASGAERDESVTRTATFTVPQGTPSIVVRYQVSSEEYPYSVLSQSIYNDWWFIQVRAIKNGAQLFLRVRQINSQLALEPIWQSNASTGELQYELDTQTLTQYGPRRRHDYGRNREHPRRLARDYNQRDAQPQLQRCDPLRGQRHGRSDPWPQRSLQHSSRRPVECDAALPHVQRAEAVRHDGHQCEGVGERHQRVQSVSASAVEPDH